MGGTVKFINPVSLSDQTIEDKLARSRSLFDEILAYISRMVGIDWSAIYPENTAVVTHSGDGTHSSLVEALEEFADATASEPGVIFLYPGEYELAAIDLPDYVYIIGADPSNTIISGDGAYVLKSNLHNRFYNLTIRNTTGAGLIFVSGKDEGSPVSCEIHGCRFEAVGYGVDERATTATQGDFYNCPQNIYNNCHFSSTTAAGLRAGDSAQGRSSMFNCTFSGLNGVECIGSFDIAPRHEVNTFHDCKFNVTNSVMLINSYGAFLFQDSSKFYNCEMYGDYLMLNPTSVPPKTVTSPTFHGCNIIAKVNVLKSVGSIYGINFYDCDLANYNQSNYLFDIDGAVGPVLSIAMYRCRYTVNNSKLINNATSGKTIALVYKDVSPDIWTDLLLGGVQPNLNVYEGHTTALTIPHGSTNLPQDQYSNDSHGFLFNQIFSNIHELIYRDVDNSTGVTRDIQITNGGVLNVDGANHSLLANLGSYDHDQYLRLTAGASFPLSGDLYMGSNPIRDCPRLEYQSGEMVIQSEGGIKTYIDGYRTRIGITGAPPFNGVRLDVGSHGAASPYDESWIRVHNFYTSSPPGKAGIILENEGANPNYWMQYINPTGELIIECDTFSNVLKIAMDLITFGVPTSGIVHADLSLLGANDHPQYLLLTGGTMTGNLNMSYNNILNVNTIFTNLIKPYFGTTSFVLPDDTGGALNIYETLPARWYMTFNTTNGLESIWLGISDPSKSLKMSSAGMQLGNTGQNVTSIENAITGSPTLLASSKAIKDYVDDSIVIKKAFQDVTTRTTWGGPGSDDYTICQIDSIVIPVGASVMAWFSGSEIGSPYADELIRIHMEYSANAGSTWNAWDLKKLSHSAHAWGAEAVALNRTSINSGASSITWSIRVRFQNEEVGHDVNYDGDQTLNVLVFFPAEGLVST